MRWNFKKIVAVGGAVVVLWLILSYSFKMDIPSRTLTEKDNIVEIEGKIERLQREVDSQNAEMTKLLDKVQSYLKTNSLTQIDVSWKHHGNKENILPEQQHVLPAPREVTVLPVLVIACDRVTVKRCLDNLVKLRPDRTTFPIIVSQDCGHNATYQVIKRFVELDPSITVVKQPDLTEIPLPRHKVKFRGYYKIARHYRFALNHVFKTLGHKAVIIVEDDLDISPDFFEYFLGTYPLLEKDPSLWCISAWNDNGKKQVIDMSRPELLHRTDFFPGLGWLLRKDSWLHLEPHWPPAFFDDWLRNPENTNGRSCIRPEISRTYTFGKVGVSKGLFFEMHLRHLQLNSDYVEFTKLDLNYLLKENYDDEFLTRVSRAKSVKADEIEFLDPSNKDELRVSYMDARTYQKAAKALGLMEDFRSGIPRTAYMGIVSCFVHGHRVYLAPGFNWSRYDPLWG